MDFYKRSYQPILRYPIKLLIEISLHRQFKYFLQNMYQVWVYHIIGNVIIKFLDHVVEQQVMYCTVSLNAKKV